MEVPLLSQDEYLRRLDLQSVHSSAAKFHYRQALKERLRASSLAIRKDREDRLNSTPEKMSSIVTEIASPCRLLSPTSSNRIFGRPMIRREKRALDLDSSKSDYSNCNGTTNTIRPSILAPLLADSRIFRHPGIRRELESRIKMNGIHILSPSLLSSSDYPPEKRTKIQVRHCYYTEKEKTTAEKPKEPSIPPKPKNHNSFIRVQPKVNTELFEQERRLAAAITFFGQPRKDDFISAAVLATTLAKSAAASAPVKRTHTPLPQNNVTTHRPAVSTSSSSDARLNGNNNNLLEKCKEDLICQSGKTTTPNLSPTVQLEKLTLFPNAVNGSIVRSEKDAPRGSRPLLHRKAKDDPPPAPPAPVVTIPQVVKPTPPQQRKIIFPGSNGYKCPICHMCFLNDLHLQAHGQNVHSKCQTCGQKFDSFRRRSLEDKNSCQTCKPKSSTPAQPLDRIKLQQTALSRLEIIEASLKLSDPKASRIHKCDICHKLFDRRNRMIRHMTNIHAEVIHKVDLSKFVYNNKKTATPTQNGH